MPDSLHLPLLLFVAYLLGSIPFAVVSSRLFGLADPRSYGSGNPGATNVLRSGSKGAAALTLLGDAAKGGIAVWLASHFGMDATGQALAGLFAFAGHLFPLFLGFKGGKGVATAAGVLLVLDVRVGLAVLAVWLASAALFRYSSLAALLAALAAPFCLAWVQGAGAPAGIVALMSVALIAKHHGNIRRLLAGEEGRIGGRRKA